MGALDGIQVVQVGDFVAAPVAGMLLADQGADVVQVQRTDGGRLGAASAVWARGKRRVLADLGTPAGRDATTRLLERADVLLDGLRSGALAARVDLDAVRAVNPGLVRLSLPGFSADDPRKGIPGWEGAVAALTGLYERPAGMRPVVHAVPVASMLAAFYGVDAVLAALLARERDGVGQDVEVPLYDAAFAAQELAALLTVSPPRVWTTLAWAASPFLAPRRCADGRFVYVHAGLSPHARRLVRALAALGCDVPVSEAALADPSGMPSVREARRVHRALDRAFATRPAEAWEAALSRAGLCVAVARTGPEWLAHPHATGSGQVVTLDDPDHGPLTQPGLAVRLSRTPGAVSPRPEAAVTADDVLGGWPEPSPRAASSSTAPPLSGTRVLDLTQVIAGPVAGRTLAELGADVVHVENPRFRAGWVEAFHLAFDAGKKSVAVDLTTPGGRAAFWKLVADWSPDVVLHNLRPGAAAKLGLDEETFRRRVPDVVYVHLTAYGTTGPWGDRPGWEQTAQAATGMQLDYGGGTPDLLPIPINDVGTGLLGAQAALLALWHRRRTGEPQRAEACLTATATLVQSGHLHTHEGKRWDQPRGRDALGFGPLQRFYRTGDGWAFLASPDAAALRAVRGLSHLPDDAPDDVVARAELEQALVTALRTEDTATWQRRIRTAGVGHRVALVPRTKVPAVMADPYAVDRGLVVRREHEGVGEATETAHPVRMSRTPLVPLAPARPRGADNPDLLGTDAPGAPPKRTGRRATARWARDQAKWAALLVSRGA